ncbi:gliding motility-associated C-terminal domain-containing protein [Bizionia myxarmorum]|uniref:Gliding motility-associated C-terminal domain-containing protein n=1 Tax=Bizionia myxarmorum TaxID=291186 RepID=A0A5D0RGC3_9FLAO|nr:gliding motility-associated C-terminal domain-containing protein [Bizionia myxarmorum]TYB79564.1 gliding motility-associated C-terminal domain-containing protein [Bizionia myxarmorum]
MFQFNKLILILYCFFSATIFSQEITLFQQFNGRYDYTAIGNTLNPFENNLDRSFCEILPESEAELALNPNWNIVAAYLYWAGSGTGDTEISVNGNSFSADTTYLVDYADPNYGLLTYFACYTDITNYVINSGNGTYTFSELDISQTLTTNSGYCNNRTNFAGWSMYIIYENTNLPINQINIFQGLEIINRNVQDKTILLENINVLDNIGAKIGFLAWEGDVNLNYGESLLINNNILSNPPLNPANNAFNGTNSFTGSDKFYNGDLDVYNIENNIAIGDNSVEIKLTTGAVDEFGVIRADLIILNNIITVLNSQLPDATIVVDNYELECATRNVNVNFTVYNINSTDILPNATPIAFYADGFLVAQSATQNSIPIDGFEALSIILNIPDSIPDNFTLKIIVDDIGNGTGLVTELNEFNNITSQQITLIPIPEATPLKPLESCDLSFDSAIFNLTEQLQYIEYVNIEDISFYESIVDLFAEENEILNPEYFENRAAPQEIFIRVNSEICFSFYNFNLIVKNCPPHIPQVFTPNQDGFNDWFDIQGLYNIFEEHQLLIYNRWGTLIFEGNNDLPWKGDINKGIINHGNRVPVATYFYVLHLNDNNFKPVTGWVFITY